jgi:hypothetical protein
MLYLSDSQADHNPSERPCLLVLDCRIEIESGGAKRRFKSPVMLSDVASMRYPVRIWPKGYICYSEARLTPRRRRVGALNREACFAATDTQRAAGERIAIPFAC